MKKFKFLTRLLIQKKFIKKNDVFKILTEGYHWYVSFLNEGCTIFKKKTFLFNIRKIINILKDSKFKKKKIIFFTTDEDLQQKLAKITEKLGLSSEDYIFQGVWRQGLLSNWKFWYKEHANVISNKTPDIIVTFCLKREFILKELVENKDIIVINFSKINATYRTGYEVLCSQERSYIVFLVAFFLKYIKGV